MPDPILTLHIPLAARAALGKEFPDTVAPAMALHDLCFDTQDQALAQAGIDLRLRQENGLWVQQLRLPDAAAATLRHDRPGPVLDLSLYTDTPVAARLARLQDALSVRHEIHIMRRQRRLRTRHGVVLATWDEGRICAAELELPLNELRLSPVSGHADGAFALARRWLLKHGLILDLRSVPERAEALATTARRIAAAGPADSPDATQARAQEIARFWAPYPVRTVRLNADMPLFQALRILSRECLAQAARNAAILAEIDTAGVYQAGQPEHLHQLRVGLRRLRSAWRLFDGWAALPPAAMQDTARDWFGRFGANRDSDVLRGSILPALQAAGMPALTLPDATDSPPSANLAAAAPFQAWLLDMLAWTQGVQAATEPQTPAGSASQPAAADDAASSAAVAIIPLQPPPAADLRSLLIQRLRKWHRGIVRDGRDFTHCDIDTRHALRKRAKRLRYGLAFAESLLPPARLRDYRRKLAKVQDILGDLNDVYVADDRFAELAESQPQAWFARGWLAARRQALELQAQDALRQLGKQDRFW